MAISTAYVLHGLVNSSTFISQISNARNTAAMDILTSSAAGIPWAQFVANTGTKPEVTFDTPQIATILGLTGALASIVDLSGANTDLLYKKVAYLGSRVDDATEEHIRFRAAEAYLSLQSITAAHTGLATATCKLGTIFDGTNKPLVPAGTVALSGTSTAAENYRLGPVFLNTVQLPGIESMTIDFGRSLVEAGGDGEMYNTFAAQQETNPVVTIRCWDLPAWVSFGLDGTVLSAGSFYLRALGAAGNVANGTASHKKFAATKGLISIDDTVGGGNEPGMTTVRVTCIGADAATPPLALTTVAITS